MLEIGTIDSRELMKLTKNYCYIMREDGPLETQNRLNESENELGNKIEKKKERSRVEENVCFG